MDNNIDMVAQDVIWKRWNSTLSCTSNKPKAQWKGDRWTKRASKQLKRIHWTSISQKTIQGQSRTMTRHQKLSSWCAKHFKVVNSGQNTDNNSKMHQTKFKKNGMSEFSMFSSPSNQSELQWDRLAPQTIQRNRHPAFRLLLSSEVPARKYKKKKKHNLSNELRLTLADFV